MVNDTLSHITNNQPHHSGIIFDIHILLKCDISMNVWRQMMADAKMNPNEVDEGPGS